MASGAMSWSRMRLIVPFVLLCLVACCGAFVAWDFTADDAYITYSQHLAGGSGVIWNADSVNPVEGYTPSSHG